MKPLTSLKVSAPSWVLFRVYGTPLETAITLLSSLNSQSFPQLAPVTSTMAANLLCLCDNPQQLTPLFLPDTDLKLSQSKPRGLL